MPTLLLAAAVVLLLAAALTALLMEAHNDQLRAMLADIEDD